SDLPGGVVDGRGIDQHMNLASLVVHHDLLRGVHLAVLESLRHRATWAAVLPLLIKLVAMLAHPVAEALVEAAIRFGNAKVAILNRNETRGVVEEIAETHNAVVQPIGELLLG